MALDIMTIKMLQEIIVNLQQEYNIIFVYVTIKLETFWLVDKAMILSNCKIIAEDTPANLINDINKKSLFW